jgi:hypothetical protein
VRELAHRLGQWSHDGADLGDWFGAEDGSFTIGVELRLDRIDDAAAFGEAVADALKAHG